MMGKTDVKSPLMSRGGRREEQESPMMMRGASRNEEESPMIIKADVESPMMRKGFMQVEQERPMERTEMDRPTRPEEERVPERRKPEEARVPERRKPGEARVPERRKPPAGEKTMTEEKARERKSEESTTKTPWLVPQVTTTTETTKRSTKEERLMDNKKAPKSQSRGGADAYQVRYQDPPESIEGGNMEDDAQIPRETDRSQGNQMDGGNGAKKAAREDDDAREKDRGKTGDGMPLTPVNTVAQSSKSGSVEASIDAKTPIQDTVDPKRPNTMTAGDDPSKPMGESVEWPVPISDLLFVGVSTNEEIPSQAEQSDRVEGKQEKGEREAKVERKEKEEGPVEAEAYRPEQQAKKESGQRETRVNVG